jgi:dCTP deaminase
MILTADQISERLDRTNDSRLVVWPLFDRAEQFERGAASLDLRLGTRFAAAKRRQLTHLDPYRRPLHPNAVVDEYYVPVGGKFILHPRHFVLASTLEWVRLSNDLAGYITCKSTLGRLGLNIATASGIHPRFAGIITLELANLADIPITIYVGQPICQVFFHTIDPLKDNAHDRTVFLGSKRPTLGWLEPHQLETFFGIPTRTEESKRRRRGGARRTKAERTRTRKNH